MERSVELRELVLSFYQAMKTADMSFIRSHLSQEEGVLSIGTDPEEWWAGYEVITEVYKAQLEAMQGFPIVEANPQAFAEGSVGWVADQVKLQLPDGNAVPLRMTMVCHKEDDEWKVVQAHASIGVPNEQAIGQDLPTG